VVAPAHPPARRAALTARRNGRIGAMRVRLSIGDFSRMSQLSVKALRHYHDVGLLVPAEVDPSSGYRYYAPEQVPLAQVVRRFRDLGMPLEEIREVLSTSDVEARAALIAAHLRRMEVRLAQAESAVAELRSLLEAPPAPVAIEHRSVGAAHALAVAARVSAADLDAWWQAAFGELDAALAGTGVPAAGPRAALYPAEFFELEEGGVVTAYLPVAAPVPAHGRVTMLEVPRAELAVAVHRGGLADLDRTYAALGTHVAQREIGVPGPIRERYLVSAFDTDDESRHVTEVCWPIFPLTVR
jgi:DNA-binding transcriptional MerR regulator